MNYIFHDSFHVDFLAHKATSVRRAEIISKQFQNVQAEKNEEHKIYDKTSIEGMF